MGSFFGDVVTTRQGLARDLFGHFLPFLERLETALHHPLLAPQHLDGHLQPPPLRDVFPVVLQVDARRGAVVFAQAVRCARQGQAALVFGQGQRIKRGQPRAALAHDVGDIRRRVGLDQALGQGLRLERTSVGDRYVVERMREGGFNLGGEQSGHIVLSDFATTGDGLVAALQVMACVQRMGRPVSEVCRRFEPVPQVLKNVRFSGGKPLEDKHVRKAIADAESELASHGRLVIRPSGTEPLIRVMAEGDDRGQIEGIVDNLITVISDVRNAA